MNIKEINKTLKEIISNIVEQEMETFDKNKVEVNRKLPDDLNEEVTEFLFWFKKNIVRHPLFREAYKNIDTKEVVNFIEKLATWYEFRYPEYKVNAIINNEENLPALDLETIISKNPRHYNSQNSFTSDYLVAIANLPTKEYNAINSLLNNLNQNELKMLRKPIYPKEQVFYYKKKFSKQDDLKLKVILSETGDILDIESYFKDISTKSNVPEELKKLIGCDIVTLVHALDYSTFNTKNKPLIDMIDCYKKEKYFRNQLLNCVMYRIIERGDKRVGGRRGLLFAHEFNRNINIPMKYGVSYPDPYLNNFINKYLSLGGNTSLNCYLNYFDRTKRNQKLEVISINDLLINPKTKKLK